MGKSPTQACTSKMDIFHIAENFVVERKFYFGMRQDIFSALFFCYFGDARDKECMPLRTFVREVSSDILKFIRVKMCE